MDDLTTAQMLSQVPEGVLSKDTARGRFSFVTNKVEEAKKVKEEQQEELDQNGGINLDKVGGANANE